MAAHGAKRPSAEITTSAKCQQAISQLDSLYSITSSAASGIDVGTSLEPEVPLGLPSAAGYQDAIAWYWSARTGTLQ
jgi:hypothetical protein